MRWRYLRPAMAGSALLVAALLGGCGGSSAPVVRDGPGKNLDFSRVPDAVPRAEPRSRGGNAASYVVFGQRYHTLASSQGYRSRGIASWYGSKFHGRKTANGEIYDMYAMTAAHRQLPIPTYVEVTNLENGRQIIVRVNDRGPFHDNRVIDLSYAAAGRLGMLEKAPPWSRSARSTRQHRCRGRAWRRRPARRCHGSSSRPGRFAMPGTPAGCANSCDANWPGTCASRSS
jgi:hypothetical protein